MFEGYVTSLVLQYGKKFIKDLPDLKLSVWGGDVELRNLQIRNDVIEQLLPGCGIMVSEGVVRDLRLHIPWTSLTSAPIEIHLDTLELNAVYDPEAAVAAAVAHDKKPATPHHENEQPPMQEKGNESEGGWGAWVVTKVRNNVSITVEKLLVRLRFQGYLITLRMDRLDCHSVNYLWERAVVEPGDTSFLRKLCLVEGVTFTVEPCDSKGVVTEKPVPLMSKVDLEARVAFLGDRPRAGLPESRVDVLCTSHLAVTISDEQLALLFRLLRVFKSRKKRRKTRKAVTTHRKPLPVAQSAPVVMQDTGPSKDPPKGWMSWMWSAVGDEAPAESSQFEVRQPAVTALSFFVFHCSLNLTTESGNLMSMVLRHGGVEILTGDVDREGPSFAFGCEQVRIEEGHTGRVMLEAKSSRTNATNGVFFDSSPSLPFSLFDKRQGVAFALDVTDAATKRQLIDHEVAFKRYKEGQGVLTIAVQQKDKWVCCDAVFVAFYSGVPREECGDDVAVPSSLVLSFSPKTCLLSFPTIFDVISFIRHGVSGRSMKMAATETEPEPSKVASPELPRAVSTGNVPFVDELRQFWMDSPPMQLTLSIAPCEVHVPVYVTAKDRGTVGLSPGQRHGSVTLAYLDHQGITFSNSASFPSAEVLQGHAFENMCQNFAQNVYNLHFQSMSFGIIHRGGSISSTTLRRTLTLKPTTCNVTFGKSVIRSSPASVLSVKALPLFLSCHRLELALLLSCIPASVVSQNWTDAALEFIHSQNVEPGEEKPPVEAEDEIVLQLKSLEFGTTSFRDYRDVSLSVGTGTVSCGSRGVDREIPPIFNLGDLPQSAFSLAAKIPKGDSSTQALEVDVAIRDCELFVVPELIAQWMLSTENSGSDDGSPPPSSPPFPAGTQDVESPVGSGAPAKFQKLLDLWQRVRGASLSVDIQKVLIRSSATTDSPNTFCLFFPELSVTSIGKENKRSWNLALTRMQLFCEELSDESSEVGHHRIVKALTVNASLASEHVAQLSAKVDILPLVGAVTLEEAQELAVLLRKFRTLGGQRAHHDRPHTQKSNARSSNGFIEWAESKRLDICVTGRLHELELQAVGHTFQVSDARVDARTGGKAAGTVASCSASVVSVKLWRDSPGLLTDPLSLFGNHLLLCNSTARGPAMDPFVRLGYSLRRDKSSGTPLEHSFTASVVSVQVFPWWPSLLQLARFVGFSTGALATVGAVPRRPRPAAVEAVDNQPPVPGAAYHLSVSVDVGEVVFALPSLLDDAVAGVVLGRVPGCSAKAELLMSASPVLRQLSASVDGGMLYIGQLDMADATAEHRVPSPGTASDLPQWMQPQLANPVRVRVTGTQPLGEEDTSLPFLSTTAAEQVDTTLQIRVSMSSVSVRMEKASLGALLASTLCAAKCSTAIRKLLSGSNGKRRPRPDASSDQDEPSAASTERQAGIVFVLDVPDVEVQLVGRAQEGGGRAMLLSRVAGLHVTSNFVTGDLDGFVEDIYVKSVSNDRLSEILGRKATNRQADATSRNFVTVSTDGKSIVLAFAPMFVSLDAALFKEHLDLASIPDWNTEVLLAYDGDIKRKQRMIRQAAGGEATGHVRRPSDSAPLTFKQAQRQKASGRVYKLLVPECKVIAAVTLAPGMSKTSNAVLSSVAQEIFVYYAQGQEHCSLSIGAVDVSISDSLDHHCPVLQPPMACHVSITEEIHAVTSALPKRALSVAVSVPVINSVIGLGQVRGLVSLAGAFQEALSPVTSAGAAKPTAERRPRSTSLPAAPVQEDLLLSSGELLREGFSVGSEREQRPFVNQITLSAEGDETDALHSAPWMSWRYPEPRSVRAIAVRPFPSVEENQEPVTFQLQYFDTMTLSMTVLCSFLVDLQAGQVLKCSVAASGSDASVVDGIATLTGAAKLVSADEWKLVAFSLPCSPGVFPLACQVRSVFLPEFSFAMRSSLQVQSARLSIVNELNSTRAPAATQGGGAEESLFAVTANDAQLSFIKWRDTRMKMGIKGEVGVEFVEGTFLTSHPILEPTSFFLLLEKAKRNTTVSLHSNSDAAVMVTKSFVDLASSTARELSSIVSGLKSPHPSSSTAVHAPRSCSASFVAVNSTNVAIQLCQSDGSSVLGQPLSVGPYSSQVFSFSALWEPSFCIRVAPAGEHVLPWSGALSPFVPGWHCLSLPCPGGRADCWLKVKEGAEGRICIEAMGNLILESHLSLELLAKPMALYESDDDDAELFINLPPGGTAKGLILFPAQRELASHFQVKASASNDSAWRDVELGASTSTALVVVSAIAEGASECSLPVLATLDAGLVTTVFFTPLVKLLNSSGLPLCCDVSTSLPSDSAARESDGLRLGLGHGRPSEPFPAREFLLSGEWQGTPRLAFRHLDGSRWTAVDDLLSVTNTSRYMALVRDLLEARSRAEAKGEPVAGQEREESLTILQQRSFRLYLPSGDGEEDSSALQLRVSLCVDVDATSLPPPLQLVVSLPFRITNLTDLPLYAMETTESGSLRCIDANDSQVLQWSSYGTEGLLTSCLPPSTPLRLLLGVAPDTEPASPTTPSRSGDLYAQLRRTITWTDVVLELKGSRKTTRLLVQDAAAGIHVPLTVQVLRHSRSTELVVASSHVVSNATATPLLLQVSPTHIVRLEAGATKDIAGPWASSRTPARLAVETAVGVAEEEVAGGIPLPEPLPQCSEWSREFRVGYVGSKEEAVARLHVVQETHGKRTGHLVTYGVRVKNSRQHTVFYTDEQPPLRIENRCAGVTVRCTPLGSHSAMEKAAFAVEPGHSADFAHPADCIVGSSGDAPVRRDIVLQWRFFDAQGGEVGDKPIVVDSSEEGTAHVPLGDAVVYVSNVRAGNTVLLVLTDKGAVLDDKAEAERAAAVTNFSFSCRSLSLCLAEELRPAIAAGQARDNADMWQELVLLSLDRCLGKFSRKQLTAAFSEVPMAVSTLHVSVGDLQLDNMLRYCEFPVVCLPTKRAASQPAVDVVAALATVQGASFLQCCSARLASLDLRLEDAFLYAVQRCVAALLSRGGPPPAREEGGGLAKAPPLPRPLLAELQRPAFYIRSLAVARLDLRLSLRVNVGIFLSLDHSPVELDAFSISGEAWRPRPLAKHLAQVYVYEMVFRAPTILGSLELMGNPTNLIRDYAAAVQELIQRPLEGAMHGPSTFVRGCVSGVSGFLVHSSRGTLTSLSGVTSSVARNLDKLSLDRAHASYRQLERMRQDEQAATSVVRGIKGFSYGVVSGISGVVSQPVAGAYQEGVSGLFAGIGRGLLGAVAKPVGGALELISYTSQGVLHAVASPLRRRRAVRPLLQLPRLPDKQPMLHCYAVQWVARLVAPGNLHGKPLFTCCGAQQAKEGSQACLLLVTSSTLYIVQRRGLARLLALNPPPGSPLGVGSLALNDVVCVRQQKDPAQVLLEAVSLQNGRITLLLQIELSLSRRFLMALVGALSRTS